MRIFSNFVLIFYKIAINGQQNPFDATAGQRNGKR